MYTLTAADFADTGQWRLIVELRVDGLMAWLENTIHKELPRQQLCMVFWEADKAGFKDNLEKAVYENPRLLDDFATKIIMCAPDTLFIPTEMLDSPGREADIFREIYKAGPEDVMSESDGDLTAAWSLGPGVRGFLLRTFPGARFSNHLLERVKTLKGPGRNATLHIESRGEETDFVLIDGDRLICASTQPFSERGQIETMIRNIREAYGIDPEIKINL